MLKLKTIHIIIHTHIGLLVVIIFSLACSKDYVFYINWVLTNLKKIRVKNKIINACISLSQAESWLDVSYKTNIFYRIFPLNPPPLPRIDISGVFTLPFSQHQWVVEKFSHPSSPVKKSKFPLKIVLVKNMSGVRE